MKKITSTLSTYVLLLSIATTTQTVSYHIEKTEITLLKDDITKIKGFEAIVNAANVYLSHGGGVALAIANAAGPKLQEYSFALPSGGKHMGEKLSVGHAISTPPFKLSDNGVKIIIHAVGPQIPVGKNPTKQDALLLYNAYFNSLLLAKKEGVKRIAFPSISTALFGYDISLATPIAKQAITDFITQYPNTFTTIAFVLFSDADYQVFVRVFGANEKKSETSDKTFWQHCIAFVKSLFGWK